MAERRTTGGPEARRAADRAGIVPDLDARAGAG
jgi:hypothetical protein